MGLEAVLTEERFASIRRHVGRANVFWSHLQKDPVMGFERDGYVSLLWAISMSLFDPTFRIKDQIPQADQCYFWVDCFCLRQAQAADFNVDAIMELIPKVGTLIGQIDELGTKGYSEYLSRTFCIFEVYAAIAGSAQLLIFASCWKSQYEKAFASKPVNAAAAKARKPRDKEAIDNLINSTVGFEAVDTMVTEKILLLTPEDPEHS